MKRPRVAGGFDFATAALIVGGALLIAVSIVAATVLVSPPRQPTAEAPLATPTPDVAGHTSAALPADRVATVLTVDAASSAAGAARAGDHVDVFGYFAHQANAGESITRVLMADVPVLSVDRAGTSVSLTLAVPQESALLLQEAQALGGQPFVALRPVQPLSGEPASFSDSDLASRLSAGNEAP